MDADEMKQWKQGVKALNEDEDLDRMRQLLDEMSMIVKERRRPCPMRRKKTKGGYCNVCDIEVTTRHPNDGWCYLFGGNLWPPSLAEGLLSTPDYHLALSPPEDGVFSPEVAEELLRDMQQLHEEGI